MWDSVRQYTKSYKQKHVVALARVLAESDLDAFRVRYTKHLMMDVEMESRHGNNLPALAATIDADDLVTRLREVMQNTPDIADSYVESGESESEV